MTEPVRAALRHGTRTAHRRLEQRLALTAPELTAPRYRDVLAGLLGIHRSLDAQLGRVAARHHRLRHWASAPRATWLEQDLRRLAVDPDGLPSPPASELPPVAGPAGALGCLYVVEGSALGGLQIVAALQSRPATRGLPCRFFTGHGVATGARWRALCHELASWAADPAAVDEMVLAARSTFTAFEGWLCTDGQAQDPSRPAAPTRTRRAHPTRGEAVA